MSKKQSNPKPKNIKRPAPPPAPPRPYSDPVVEDMIEGLKELERKVKDTKKKNEGRMINPRDYLRTVIEGDKKPDRSFIWTEDSMEKLETGFRGMNGCVGETKKVYCEDCKYLDHNPWIKINLCYKVMGYNDNPIHRTAIYADLEACNKNNDCPHYEEKWYKKLFKTFCK